MEPAVESRSELFFFPKRNPPVSIRAANLEEAEHLLEAAGTQLKDPNPKEHD